MLDELNQTFFTKAAPADRRRRRASEPLCGRDRRDSRIYSAALSSDDISILATQGVDRADPGHAGTEANGWSSAEAPPMFPGDAAPSDRIRTLVSPIYEPRGAQLDAFSEQIPTTMVMEEMPGRARPTSLLAASTTGPVQRFRRAFRGAFPAAEQRPCVTGWPWPAGWFRRANPLSARVAVNRDWQMLFGTGLVKTLDDFGAQGEPPSHPELLDWLAARFQSSGWDMKRLLRLIVTSATYRQASRVSRAALERDPENRLLSHGPRLRLPAEMIRDQALSLGGLLVERTGGPSVKPYQPAGLWNELADADYVQDHGPSLYRRSLYTFWKRTVPPPAMVAFDAPAARPASCARPAPTRRCRHSTCSTTSRSSRPPAALPSG